MAAESEDSPALRAGLIMVAVLVLYVLSIGPVSRYALALHRVPAWVEYAYFPVTWAAERWEPAGAALDWYCELWDWSGGAVYDSSAQLSLSHGR